MTALTRPYTPASGLLERRDRPRPCPTRLGAAYAPNHKFAAELKAVHRRYAAGRRSDDQWPHCGRARSLSASARSFPSARTWRGAVRLAGESRRSLRFNQAVASRHGLSR